jgi:hypothetical protein
MFSELSLYYIYVKDINAVNIGKVVIYQATEVGYCVFDDFVNRRQSP